MAPPRGCREDCGHFQSGRAGLHAIHNQIQHCHRIAPITVSSIAPKQQSLLQCLEQLKRTFCLIHLFKWTAETINWQAMFCLSGHSALPEGPPMGQYQCLVQWSRGCPGALRASSCGRLDRGRSRRNGPVRSNHCAT